jgi:hypothetical protein
MLTLPIGVLYVDTVLLQPGSVLTVYPDELDLP